MRCRRATSHFPATRSAAPAAGNVDAACALLLPACLAATRPAHPPPPRRSGPVTSVEWCPYESSMLATTSSDNQLAVWDLALERDPGGGPPPGHNCNTASWRCGAVRWPHSAASALPTGTPPALPPRCRGGGGAGARNQRPGPRQPAAAAAVCARRADRHEGDALAPAGGQGGAAMHPGLGRAGMEEGWVGTMRDKALRCCKLKPLKPAALRADQRHDGEHRCRRHQHLQALQRLSHRPLGPSRSHAKLPRARLARPDSAPLRLPAMPRAGHAATHLAMYMYLALGAMPLVPCSLCCSPLLLLHDLLLLFPFVLPPWLFTAAALISLDSSSLPTVYWTGGF